MTREQRQRRRRKVTEVAECGTRKSSRLKRPVKRLQIT
ncbi:hypothetical protein MAR_000102 [Mya arenaria]|uniref:Uncharacterized protein n=1 Tax=Mya arenaria TaxID=6604 RepID=A0ABY7FAU1_MYAAR|nr:hypothetical protein MAR_000102 [Mya arenaria]